MCTMCVCMCVEEDVGGTLVLQQQTSSLASPVVQPHRFGEAARQSLCSTVLFLSGMNPKTNSRNCTLQHCAFA